jgi:hypothetical protein
MRCRTSERRYCERGLNRKEDMRRLLLAALTVTVTCISTCVLAQSDAPGPLATPSGALRFVRVDRGFVGMLGQDTLDRFTANALAHFDDTEGADHTVGRTLVQTDHGPVLYDLRSDPPLVQRFGKRMKIKRVFWQRDEVVLQSSEGWFRFKSGALTRLRSSKTTYH